MLQYLVILLDDTSVAYCHAENPLKARNLMPLDTLRKAVLFGMKENLMIQYVYPEYDLPEEYHEVIESIDHVKIGRDVAVYNEVPTAITADNAVLRLPIADFISRSYDIAALIPQVKRLNICITDIEHFKDEQCEQYSKALATLSEVLLQLGKADKQAQVNILTDRLQLKHMHNCGAGDTNITVAPNGKFYLCPAFYYDEKTGISNRLNHHKPTSERSVGDLDYGVQIPNPQLLKLDHAPLCRICDAFHCNRCVWLNQKLTWDANTPSHQQCVLAHLERNATRDLQAKMMEAGFEAGEEIKPIDYLDPFDVREEF
ncbi:MAG: CXXX repeat peptide maturase [Paludibacteraceae bacterium]|nr:CXXX repeat peptide maturase [Paludibacteraceae bacterium]